MEQEQKTSEKPTAEWVKNIPLAEGDKIGRQGEILGVAYAMVERERHNEIELIIDKRVVSHHLGRHRYDMLEQDLFVVENVGRIPSSEAELKEMEEEYLSSRAANKTSKKDIESLLGEELSGDK